MQILWMWINGKMRIDIESVGGAGFCDWTKADTGIFNEMHIAMRTFLMWHMVKQGREKESSTSNYFWKGHSMRAKRDFWMLRWKMQRQT